MSPLVSVIVTTYNRKAFLNKCLSSLAAEVFKDFEVVLVNDAGEDVQDVVDNWNDKITINHIVHENNQGLAAARNTGISFASPESKYLMFLDDDDGHYPNCLQMLSAILEQNPQFKIIYCDAVQEQLQLVENDYRVVNKSIPYSVDYDPDILLVQNITPVDAVMFSKEILGEDRLDPTLSVYEDWDFWIRLFRKGGVLHYPIPLVFYTYRTDGTTMSSSRTGFTDLLPEIYGRYKHLANDASKVAFMQNQALNARGLPIFVD